MAGDGAANEGADRLLRRGGARGGHERAGIGGVLAVLGRLRGPPRAAAVLLVVALVSMVAMLAFAALRQGASLAVILPCAVVAGAAMPPLGACLRTLWPALLDSSERMHAAFALDAAVLETAYIAGPVLIAGAIGSWSTAASAVTCALLLAAGTRVFVTVTGVACLARGPAGRRAALAGVRTLTVIFVLIGRRRSGRSRWRPRPRPTTRATPVARDGCWAAGGSARSLEGCWRRGLRRRVDRVRRLVHAARGADAPATSLLALPDEPGVIGRRCCCWRERRSRRPSVWPTGLDERAAAEGTVTEAYTWLIDGNRRAESPAGRRSRACWPKARAGRSASSTQPRRNVQGRGLRGAAPSDAVGHRRDRPG